MLASIRAFAKSWFATALIGALIVSFAIWGVSDVFKGRATNQVIVAGDRAVSPLQFKNDWDRAKKNLEQQYGQPITNEVAVENHIDTRLLDDIATSESLAALMSKIGIRPSDALVQAQIQKVPNFFDQVSGRFDKKLYLSTLQQNNLTPAEFEGSIRDDIAQQHLGAALANGIAAPRAYAALGAVFLTESRDVGYFALGAKDVPAVAPPTDAQLTRFMQDNSAALMRPEFRILTVVRFSPSLVSANIPVTEAEIQKQFDFRKDTLNKPETRSLVQIPGKDAKTAQAVAARLAKGEAPSAIAQSIGVEAITYADKPKSAVADPKVAEAAFSMAKDAVQVVQGDLGPAVVKVSAITPGHTATIAEVRPMLEAEARKTAAAEKVYELSQKYDDAHQGGASLAEAAQKAGVPTMTLGPISQQGQDVQAQRPAGVSPKLLQVAFNLPAGGESEIEDEGNGESFAVRVEKIIPKSLPPLDEVRPMLTRVWMARETAKRLQAKADELSARVRKGESLEAVAGSVGAQVRHAAALDRRSAAQNKEFSQEGLGKLFGAAQGEVFTAEAAQTFGFIVAKLEAIHAPSPAQLAEIVDQARPQVTQAVFRELSMDVRKSARRTIKPRIYPDVARAVLGVEAPAKGKKKSEKAS